VKTFHCSSCHRLEQILAAAEKPDAPHVLLRLTEAAIRNRTLQRCNGDQHCKPTV